ncbi:MAG: COG3650 family protein [Gemmatimonadaceae bacterium]
MAALLLAVTACGGDRSPSRASASANAPDTASAVVYRRGTLLVDADSTMRLAVCGTTTERALTAAPGTRLIEAVTAVNGGFRDSLFVELMADTSRDVLVARETLFAASLAEGSRCDQPRAPFDWVATGVEPFWRVTYDGTQLVLERPEPPRELVFDAQPPEVRGTLTTIHGTRALGTVHELKLGILREGCRNGMSDAWYPYRAEVRAGDVALAGCARR